ncbi:hypothetical protein ACQP1W_02760 [Spirillospora sp. CA-255316]
MHRRIAIGAAVIAIALVSALVYAGMRPSPEPPPRGLAGKVTIVDTGRFRWDPGTCGGRGRFADITEGAQILIKDPDGKTLTAAKLGPGMPEKITRDAASQNAAHCTFLIPAATVPSRASYQVQIGRQPPSKVAGPDIGRLTLRFGS